MNKLQTAWITVPPMETWNLILPLNNTNKNLNLSKIPLAVGHNNKLYSAIVSNNFVANSKDLYPIRIKKLNRFLKVGPIVGIFTINGPNGFKGNKNNYKSIIQMGMKTGVFVYVFTAKSIDMVNKTVKAYIFLPQQKKWIIKTMPLPDVVYNRIPYRRDEEKPIVKEAVNFLNNENIPFFNPYFFNKWALYKWMKESDEFKKLIPETTILSKENLYYLLGRNHILYLKPINGKAGLGFIKIENTNNYFELIYQFNKGTITRKFNTFSKLWSSITKLTANREYIIQSGIELITYDGSPYDIRILVQKNGYGKWLVSGIGIRVAGKESITTHVPRGGYIESIDKVFNNSFGTHYSDDLKEKISDLAIRIAQYIEKRIGYPLGELSIDLGIDKKENIWFFEANSKPMEFDEPNIRETSLLRLMQYFRYLSGFNETG